MIIKTRGIVLRAVKYSETSLIIDVYTEEKGLRSYIVSGVRTKKARVPASLLQPMTLLNMVAYHREEKVVCRTKELSTAEVYQSLPFDLRKGAVGMFVVELLHKTLKEPDTNTELFEFLFDFFVFLDQTKHPVKNIHLCFMLRYSAYLGFQPGGQYSGATPIFDLQEGVFTEVAGSTYYLKAPFSQIFDQLLNCPLEECHTLPISRSDRKYLLEELIKFYRLHIENLPVIYAHSILEEIFDS